MEQDYRRRLAVKHLELKCQKVNHSHLMPPEAFRCRNIFVIKAFGHELSYL